MTATEYLSALRSVMPIADGDLDEAMTQWVNPSSLYALTPTTEEIATALAATCRPEPVSRFEIAAATSPRVSFEDGAPDSDRDPDPWAYGGPS